MRGRPPKADPQDGGRRRGFEFTELGRDPVATEQKLGRRPGGGRWMAEALRCWRTYSTSPQSTQFADTDWETLRRMVVLVDQFYRDPSSTTSRSISQLEAKLGGTIADRQQLRLRIHSRVAAEPVEPAAVAEPTLRRVAGDPRLALVQKQGDA